MARVMADPPPVPEAAAHPAGYSKLLYYRLHGSPRVYYSNYSVAYLTRLATAICADPYASEIWCIFDNTASGAAIDNALTLVGDLTTAAPRL